MNLELFCCSGGMAEGFRRAGIVFDLAFDASPEACESYERNLGHRPVQMDVRDLLRMASAGWRPAGGIGLLVADPPCTPWSRAGKRDGVADERDMLEDTCELIALLRPRAYLIGNVPGLSDSNNLPVVQRTIGRLDRVGYCTADYKNLDAADFGVPQHRVRPWWFGHLDGACIRWPTPTHGDPAEVVHAGLPYHEPLKPWATCRQALGHIPLEELGRLVRLRPVYGNGKYWSELDAPALTVLAHESARGGQWLRVRPDHHVATPDEPARTITTRRDDARCMTMNAKHQINHADAPSFTVATVSRGAQGASAIAWPYDRHALGAVVLSERAAAILQGFPESWHFAGRTKTSRWSQIGQAMPPGLAEAVAQSVVRQKEA